MIEGLEPEVVPATHVLTNPPALIVHFAENDRQGSISLVFFVLSAMMNVIVGPAMIQVMRTLNQ